MYKGKFINEKKVKMQRENEMKFTNECTFTPRVSSPPRSFRESEFGSVISSRKERNVFDFLYEEGKQRQMTKFDKSPTDKEYE